MLSRSWSRGGKAVFAWLSSTHLSAMAPGRFNSNLLQRNVLHLESVIRERTAFSKPVVDRDARGHIRKTEGSGFDPSFSTRFEKDSQALEEMEEAVHFLDSLKNFEKQGVPEGAGTESDKGFDLDRMRRLLTRLDDPHLQYPVVHVAGTKGKGSTVTFISSILRAAGLSVGTYTSPHLLSIRERIVCGKSAEVVSGDGFGQLFQDLRGAMHEAVTEESGALTHFEVLTALAFAYFAREKVDVAVIEVGLGGARDATNVVPAAGLAVSVIVSIGEEHLAALGGSLRSIALAKAGIIKEGRPVILGRQPHRLAEEVVCSVAAAQRSHVIKAFGTIASYTVKNVVVDSQQAFQTCNLSVNLKDDGSGLQKSKGFCATDLRLRLLGAQQLDNAITSICAALELRNQGWDIPDGAITKGLESAFLAGRFQVLTGKEAEHLGCAGFTVVLDGAHTPESGATLSNTLQAFSGQILVLVVAMASDKDHQGFASSFMSGIGKSPQVVITAQVCVADSQKRSTSSTLLLDAWTNAAHQAGIQVCAKEQDSPLARKLFHTSEADNLPALTILTSSSVASAVRDASKCLEEAQVDQAVICVTGSLHAVGAVLSSLGKSALE